MYHSNLDRTLIISSVSFRVNKIKYLQKYTSFTLFTISSLRNVRHPSAAIGICSSIMSFKYTGCLRLQ